MAARAKKQAVKPKAIVTPKIRVKMHEVKYIDMNDFSSWDKSDPYRYIIAATQNDCNGFVISSDVTAAANMKYLDHDLADVGIEFVLSDYSDQLSVADMATLLRMLAGLLEA